MAGYPWISGQVLTAADLDAAFTNLPTVSSVTATGSTTARTLADRFADAVNVLDSGADRTGTSDSSSAFRAALAVSRTVVVPAGTYLVSGATFTLLNGTRLLGAGSASTVIKPTSQTDPRIFGNSLLNTLGAFTTVPTSAANQTDGPITIEGFRFDLSLCPTSNLGTFVFARKIRIRDVVATNGTGITTTGFSGFQFIGCDDVAITDFTAINVENAVDCWKGTTRVKVRGLTAELRTGGGNGGAINFDGVGTIKSDRETSSDLQVSTATISLNGSGIGIWLDSLGGGSRTETVLLSDIRIVARSGSGNVALIGRGAGGRVSAQNVMISADTGASYSAPITLGGYFSEFPASTGTGVINTTSGSHSITVSFPSGTDVGVGNYVRINNGSGGSVVGNGLTLNGYYPVTAISGPTTQSQSGTSVTVTAPAGATSTGPLVATTSAIGYYGSFNDCALSGITLDGVVASGADLISLQGSGHRVSGITVTQNYNGSATPQYRSIVSIDGTTDYDSTWRASSVVNIIGTAGTGSLSAGFAGNNTLCWNPFGPAPATQIYGGIDAAAVGATTPSSGAFTTLSASGAVSGAGFSTYLASPPAIGATVPSSGAFTALSASTTMNATGWLSWGNPGNSASIPAGTFWGAAGTNFTSGQAEVDFWNTFNSPGQSFIFWQRVTAGPAATRLLDIGPTGNLRAYGGIDNTAIGATTPAAASVTQLNLTTSAGPNIRAGTGAASGTQPKGSLWMRTDGGVGTTMYVSQGGGTWNPVAGV